MTLRTRFALWIAGLLMVVMAVFGVLVYTSLARGLNTSIDDSLQLTALQAITMVNSEDGHIEISENADSTAGLDLSSRGLTMRFFDPQGGLIDAFGPYASMPLRPADLATAHAQRSGFFALAQSDTNNTLRIYTLPIIEGRQITGILQVMQNLDYVVATLSRLRTTLIISAPFLAIAAARGGYVLAAKALAPIDIITRTAGRISSQDLSARLDLPPTHDEVGRLSTTFDRMLARLEEAFRRERRFVADASHELRTPLAAMQAILSVMREEQRTPEEYEQTLDDLTEETDRLRTLVEDLLHLARNDKDEVLVRESVELSPLLESVTEALRPLAESKGLTLTSLIDDNLNLMGDEDALIRVFVNLLDNAVKYTDRGEITLTARNEGKAIQIAIADTGIGIPSDHIPHIFERFYRVDASRSGRGSGLGLAIAQGIVNAHNGTLRVESQLGAGTVFTTRLPTA